MFREYRRIFVRILPEVGQLAMDETYKLAAHDAAWSHEFLEVGGSIRKALGGIAIRIDHVGSTSVPGLDAKPIVDIQISVRELDPVSAYASRLAAIGFSYREANPDKSKRYFREAPGAKRTHIHVRRTGSWSEQMTLLFRDYLRTHPQACRLYEAEKHRLLRLHPDAREQYVEGKADVVWKILRLAHVWSQSTGWQPGPSDA